MENEKTETVRSYKKILVLAVIVAIVALAGLYFIIGNSTQVVAAGDTINVTYTGAFTNGTVFDSNVGKQALTFTVGANQLIRGFDQGVIGMKLNEQKTITIPPSEAYGEINSSLILQVPISEFGNQSVYNGMVVRTQSGEQAVITAVIGNSVTVDFNPPLAGQTLVFTIKIDSIKKG